MIRRAALVLCIITIFVGVVLAYQSAMISSRSGDDAPLYSVRRHDPYGTAALRDLLRERGVPVKTLERPMIEQSDRGVLIQVLPAHESFSLSGQYRLRTRDLEDWIAGGNTVVQFTRGGSELMSRFKLSPTTQPSGDIRAVEDAEASGELPKNIPGEVYLARPIGLPGDARISLRSPMELNLGKETRWQPLARMRSKSSGIVAGELRIGPGKLVIIGAPTPTLNGDIADHANLDFVLSLIGNGPVIFDEWSHGVGHEATIIGFLHDVGLLPVLVQLGLLAILYAWSTSGHLQIETGEVTRQRSSIEQVETLGFLYSQSLGKDVAFDRVKAEVQRRLCEALRCKPVEMSARLTQLPHGLAENAQEMLQRLEQVEPVQRARCQSCGYDLTLNESGTCPECGTTISAEIKIRIQQAGAGSGQNGTGRPARADAVFAEALTKSHQLCQEIQRDRRSKR